MVFGKLRPAKAPCQALTENTHTHERDSARRAPFSTATYPTRDDLRYLGSRYGRARVRGRLFTAAHPSFLYHLEPLAALLGARRPVVGCRAGPHPRQTDVRPRIDLRWRPCPQHLPGTTGK
jgi:hypothetical protein